MEEKLTKRNEEITTIKLHKKTKERLEKLRVYKRESYDEILGKILDLLNLVRQEPDRARAKLIALDRQKLEGH